jgi:hypothetical protein
VKRWTEWIPAGLIIVGLLAIVAGLVGLGIAISNTPFLAHPLGYCTGSQLQIKLCRGYNFWSGIGSDISEVTLVIGILTMGAGLWRAHNCHYQRCWRLGRFRHGHFVLCHVHHPLVPSDGQVTGEHIDAVTNQ